jgi:hypothetical protein
LDEEKPKHAHSAQQNWFWPHISVRFEKKGKPKQSITHAREECNKYDLTAAPCFLLGNHYDDLANHIYNI